MIRRPPTSTPFPTRRSSDLSLHLRLVASARRRRLPLAQREQRSAERGLLRLRRRLDGDPEDVGLKLHQPTVARHAAVRDRKSTRLNSSHQIISYAVFCLKKK